MGNKAWKEWERVVARKIFGRRRGAYTGDGVRGETDIVHRVVAAECKLLGQPRFADLQQACVQARENGGEDQIPIAFVRKKRQRWQDALCVMRLEDFAELCQEIKEAGLGEGIDGES